MKKCNKASLLFLTISLIFADGCNKEDKPKFTKSERQLYAYQQGSAGFHAGSPTLVNNYIYIGTSRARGQINTSGNAFYKFDKSLNKIWEYPLGDFEVKGAAALDEFGNIYFVAGLSLLSTTPTDVSTKLFSLDNNGNFRWSRVIDSIHSPESQNTSTGPSSPAISIDNIIYVGGDNFYAFDVTGNIVWVYNLPVYTSPSEQSTTSPVIEPAGNIFFVSGKRELVSLDKNGNERWRALDGLNNSWNFNAMLSSPAFSVDYSKIYLPTLNKVYCLNSGTGSIIWEWSIPEMTGWFRGTPAVDDHDNVYIGTHGEYADDSRQMLYAIKADGSGILWKNNIGSDMYSSPALGNDRVVYIGCEDYSSRDEYNRIHALDMATGNKIWSASIATPIIWSSAAISDEGILYIGSMAQSGGAPEGVDPRGAIYGFQTDCTGLLQNSGSPRFHGGNSNTGRRD